MLLHKGHAMLKFLILLTVFFLGVLSFIGLRSLHKSSITTVLDKGSLAGRVTGRIHYHGYGQPFVYLETKDYREHITGEPDPDDIAAVRKAGREMTVNFSPSGRRWHIGTLLINLIIYLAVSVGFVGILYALWHSLGMPSRITMNLERAVADIKRDKTAMTSFPGSPRLLKGAIVGIDLFNLVPSVIVFQYKPHTRTLQAQTVGGEELTAPRPYASRGAGGGPQAGGCD